MNKLIAKENIATEQHQVNELPANQSTAATAPDNAANQNVVGKTIKVSQQQIQVMLNAAIDGKPFMEICSRPRLK